MSRDRDIPGEHESFIPAPEVIVETQPDGRKALVNVIPLPIAEQQAIHHNQIRYAELQKLRQGQPNVYNESRYR